MHADTYYKVQCVLIIPNKEIGFQPGSYTVKTLEQEDIVINQSNLCKLSIETS